MKKEPGRREWSGFPPKTLLSGRCQMHVEFLVRPSLLAVAYWWCCHVRLVLRFSVVVVK
jgi:hypothetical protein